MEPTDRTDEQLAALAVREGSDGPAFVALLGRYRDRVWRTCYRLMGNADDATDAAQEVFVRLFLHRGRFAGRSKYGTWVHGIALRTCLALRRSRARRQQRVALADTTEAEDRHGAEPASGLRLDLMRMLEILDEEDRAMMILKHAEGYSYEDLAELFGLSESACKMRLSRAREKLKQRFPDLVSEDSMASDLFDQLAIGEVPPTPPQFERRVHERLNRALLFGHLADFVVRAAPSVFIHFAAAVWGLVHFTVMGRYPARGGGNEQSGHKDH